MGLGFTGLGFGGLVIRGLGFRNYRSLGTKGLAFRVQTNRWEEHIFLRSPLRVPFMDFLEFIV